MTIIHSSKKRPIKVAAAEANSRGMALVTTLLLLSLMVAMTLAMVIAVTSDSLITRYYRNFRASFYAADSGLNVSRQYMLDQLEGNIATGSIAPNTAPLQNLPGALSSITSSVTTLYGPTGAASNRSLNGGQGAGSWPGSFQVTSVTLGSGAANGYYNCYTKGSTTNNASCSAPTGNPTEFYYTIPYTLTAVGQSLANEQTTIVDSGNLQINVPVAPGSNTLSFSAWGTFLDQYAECSTPFAPGTLTGPFFTNGAWTFEPGSYTFTGSVGSVSSTFGYYYGNGNCVQSANPSYKQNGTTIAPSFQDGYKLGQTAVTLPQNDFNQKEAVLDGLGNGSESPTSSNMSAVLKTLSGTPYPSGGTTNNGVYLPYTTSGGTNTMSGGGIYVEGNASSVVLTATTPSVGPQKNHPLQVITIQQTNGGTTTTTTVTLDLASASNGGQTTTVQQQVGSGTPTSMTIQGVPQNFAATPPTESAMLYVDGNINSLSGPGQGQAAIQDTSAMTVTAANNVVVTGDVLYKTPPVTTTQNETVNGVTYPNVDTLIPGNNNGQVLGIFTASGDVQMNDKQSNGNIELDASIAMISQNGSGGWSGTSGNNMNTVTLVGGRIANIAKTCYCNSRNLYFDQRFAAGAFSPPWFPSTTLSTGSNVVDPYTATTVRTGWTVQNY
jgi:hypothetical protein